MARLGLFCPPWIGHLNPLLSLARELAGRGHDVVFFQPAGHADRVRKLGFQCETFGAEGSAPDALRLRNQEMSRLAGLPAMSAGLKILTEQAEALFATARPVIENAGLDLWLVDHMDYAASTLASVLRAPFVTVIVTLMRHVEEGVPGFSGELYPMNPAARERDWRFNEAMLEASRAFREQLGAYRERAGLEPFSFQNLWSNLAQITQQPAEFEFPRRDLPECFHFTGPFASGSKPEPQPEPFPWDRLTGKPLVYASFGTAQNRIRHLYEAVVRAAAGLDAQFVLSLGGADPPELDLHPPANVLVTPFAPQLQLLERASLMITHAGMNSTLECLSAGVPMVAVPVAHDQPGVSARIVWSGTGVRIPASECEPARLREAVIQVLKDPSFTESARRFKRLIAQGNGLKRAADIIERVVATGRPVLRPELSEEPLIRRGAITEQPGTAK